MSNPSVTRFPNFKIIFFIFEGLPTTLDDISHPVGDPIGPHTRCRLSACVVVGVVAFVVVELFLGGFDSARVSFGGCHLVRAAGVCISILGSVPVSLDGFNSCVVDRFLVGRAGVTRSFWMDLVWLHGTPHCHGRGAQRDHTYPPSRGTRILMPVVVMEVGLCNLDVSQQMFWISARRG